MDALFQNYLALEPLKQRHERSMNDVQQTLAEANRIISEYRRMRDEALRCFSGNRDWPADGPAKLEPKRPNEFDSDRLAYEFGLAEIEPTARKE